MKTKVCGVKYHEDLVQLNALGPDYLGFIFYKNSARYMAETLFPESTITSCKKVGVFVDADIKTVEKLIDDYKLDAVQLHGKENPGYCGHFYSRGVEVIKAFAINESFHFSQTVGYKKYCHLFLFDTKGDKPGGNGVAFDWRCLQQYDHDIPFFLSGGIGPANIDAALAMKDYNMYGLDINSGIEDAPGKKNILKAGEVITTIKNLL